MVDVCVKPDAVVLLGNSSVQLDHSLESADINSDFCKSIQEAQLMLTNPHDAFRGQPRSPNMVPFHMLGTASY